MRRAVVIGGGPAGTATGVHLARAGWGVSLVEQRAYPRAKVCGEFISPSATGALESVIAPERLAARGAVRVDRVAIEAGGRERTWRLSCPGWALGRGVLDAELIEAARGAGATIVQPARVVEVVTGAEGVEVRLDGGGVIRGDVVVHADGRGRLDAGARATPEARGLVALKCHLRSRACAAGEVRLRACRGAYVGVIGIEGGRGTCALVVRKSLLREVPEPDALVGRLCPWYSREMREGEWLACGVARSGLVRGGHARSLRVGNAAGAVDPVGGEGIGLALWGASRLAGELVRGGSIEEAGARYAEALRARLRARRLGCAAAAWVLMRPRVVSAGWKVLDVPRAWSWMTGKGGGGLRSA